MRMTGLSAGILLCTTLLLGCEEGIGGAADLRFDGKTAGLEGDNVQEVVANLAARVAELEGKLSSADERIEALEQDLAKTKFDTNNELDALAAADALVEQDLEQLAVLEAADAALDGRIDDVTDKTDYIKIVMAEIPGMEADGPQPNVVFEGVNVHVRNGHEDEKTTSSNGLGNLVIGYHELRGGTEENVRTGSHNVLVGMDHNYTKEGGLAVGYHHALEAVGAAVVGGAENSVTGPYGATIGGKQNTVVTDRGVVTGGFCNEADGTNAWISGVKGNCPD